MPEMHVSVERKLAFLKEEKRKRKKGKRNNPADLNEFIVDSFWNNR